MNKSHKKLNLDRLNPGQLEAVKHTNGPLLILAGAGSGKTSTMAHRMAYMVVEKSISPENILGLSFTRKAANELSDRVKSYTGSAAPLVSTFHALCVKILRQNAETLGYPKSFTILDAQEQKDILKQIFRQVKIDDRKFDLDRIAFLIGQIKNRGIQGTQAPTTRYYDEYQDVAETIFTHYRNELLRLGSMDFDDLLYNTLKLFTEYKGAAEFWSRKFKYILVDEYQDTNLSQFGILSGLTSTHDNLCVVGDDDQSIYAWRGADPTHILEFKQHFKNAHVITLEQNYRSTNHILKSANHLIAKNKKRHPKNLWSKKGDGSLIQQITLEDDRAEAQFVASEIERIHREENTPYHHFAVLYRSNPQSRVLEESLRGLAIPYKLVGSMSFLDRKEIKDVLAYWRLCTNPNDEPSLRRVINWPARGIGKKTLLEAQSLAVSQSCGFSEALKKVELGKSQEGVQKFYALLDHMRASLAQTVDAPSIADWARQSLDLIGVRDAIQKECDTPEEAERRIEMAYELGNALGQIQAPKASSKTANEPFGLSMLAEFLSKMALREADDKKDDQKESTRDEVNLMTLHSAKGLEFNCTIMVGMEDGLLPHQKSIDSVNEHALAEERRLCYVGITRARETLLLTLSKNRIRYGKKLPRTPSRFLDELPKELVQKRDQSENAPIVNQEAHEIRVKGFLDEMRKKLTLGQNP